ncbi:MAG: hypothetical protein SV186_03910 [Candidatus Nanohaloarchaea archaeon]|nr:hypothetical protein [Candidatus Nanohaloarchaea archaeon]
MADYDALLDDLEERDVHNTGETHLFDMEDETVDKLYDKVQTKAEPAVNREQKVSKKDILSAVEQAEGSTLLVYDGDAKRLWGAVPELEDEHDFAYAAATPERADLETLAERSILPWHETEREALPTMIREMGAAFSRVKDLGYDDLESFYEDRRQDGDNLAVGIEKTEVSELYGREDDQAIYDALRDEIDRGSFDSVVYVKENMDTTQAKRSLRRDGDQPWKGFLRHANQQGCSVDLVELSHGNYGELRDEVKQHLQMERMQELAEQAAAQEQAAYSPRQ